MSNFDPDDELAKRRIEKRAESVTPEEIMRAAWEMWRDGQLTSRQLAQTCKIVADATGRPPTPPRSQS